MELDLCLEIELGLLHLYLEAAARLCLGLTGWAQRWRTCVAEETTRLHRLRGAERL